MLDMAAAGAQQTPSLSESNRRALCDIDGSDHAPKLFVFYEIMFNSSDKSPA
jgi:hypothetical protein